MFCVLCVVPLTELEEISAPRFLMVIHLTGPFSLPSSQERTDYSYFCGVRLGEERTGKK